MRLHEQANAFPLKPPTAVTVANFCKIQGPIEFIAPIVVFNVPHGGIHEHDAARPKQRRHVQNQLVRPRRAASS